VLTPTLDTEAYKIIEETPVGAVYTVCSPGATGTAIVINLLSGAIAISYLNASMSGVTSA
jgi:hypothetical protein